MSIAVVAKRKVAPIFELPRTGERAAPSDAAQISEARRIKGELARELHDLVVQELTSVLVQTQVFALDHIGNQQTLDQLASVRASIRGVLNNVRQILADLRGQSGPANDLVAAVRENLVPAFENSTGMMVSLSVDPSWPAALPPVTCLNIYRIIQEALTNAHKHSGSRTADVALTTTTDRQMVVTVTDQGHGNPWLGESTPVGMGVVGMKERAELLGGRLTVQNRPGGGTAVTANLTEEAARWSSKHVPSAS